MVGALAIEGAEETSGFVAINGTVARDTGNASRVSAVGNDGVCDARNAFRRASSVACGWRGAVLATTGVGFARAGAGDFGFSATTATGLGSDLGVILAVATSFFTGGAVATTLGFASGSGHSFLASASDFGAGGLVETTAGFSGAAALGF